jgi:hypothetical protein
MRKYICLEPGLARFTYPGKEVPQHVPYLACPVEQCSPERAVLSRARAEQGIFNWFKNWYPVAVADDLDPLKPFATKLLGAPPDQRLH